MSIDEEVLTTISFSWNEGLFGKHLLMRRCYIVKKETRAPFEETKFCPSPSHAPSHELLGWLRERERRSPSCGKMNILRAERIRVRGIANALRKQAHEAPGNHAFLPGWAQGQQSAAYPVVDSSFLTDPIGCS
ncbi:hypothetical protein HN51_009099 [Arachis hypogaea]